MPGGRPLLFPDVEELRLKIAEYFKSCWEHKRDMFGNKLYDKEEYKATKEKAYVMIQRKPYTVGGLAVFLGCDRDTLINYGEKEEFFGTIKEAKEKIKAYAEEALYTGKNQAGAIFVMKNNYKWTDKHELDVSGNLVDMPTIKINGKELEIDIGDRPSGDSKDPGETTADPIPDQ